MRVHIEKASDWNYESTKEFSTFDELITYMRNIDSRWIIEFKPWGNNENTKPSEFIDIDLTIYDDYVE